MIRTVLHISETTCPDPQTVEEQAQDIKRLFLQQNLMDRVNGILTHDDKHFFHVIEGERKVVDAVLTEIEQDTRNANFSVLFDVLWDKPNFGNWHLFEEPTEDQSNQLNEYLKVNIDALPMLEDDKLDILSKFVERDFH